MRDILMLIGVLPIIRPKFYDKKDIRFITVQTDEDRIRNRKQTEELFELIK